MLWLLLVAVFLSAVLGQVMRVSNRASATPAGFSRGLLHGALMPAAMPRLMVGQDISIYAPVNTGWAYKLGYTVGVNGCGAVFFGIFFWRVNRWRKIAKG